MPPRALITGVSGQDGSYLAELLLERGYEVYGTVRRDPSQRFANIDHLRDRLQLLRAELRGDSLRLALETSRPDEIYHLASPTFVPDLWDRPGEAVDGIVGVSARLLEVIRDELPTARVLLAGSREMFGDAGESPQRETTPCEPTNPYGIAKLATRLLGRALREHDGLHVSTAILYNHESPRRPPQFVTRKVTRAAAAIKLGLQDELVLGDVSAIRDWSYAGDAMAAAWSMLQRDEPDDYVIASGTGRTVQELVRTAFACVSLDPDAYLRRDPALARSWEGAPAVGDPTKAREQLGWTARMSFEAMIGAMVEADLRQLSQTEDAATRRS